MNPNALAEQLEKRGDAWRENKIDPYNINTAVYITLMEVAQAVRMSVRIEEKYNELLMAVERKHPSESRHETALRYITAAEKSHEATPAQAGLPGSSGSSKADERTNTEHNGAQEHNAAICDGANGD